MPRNEDHGATSASASASPDHGDGDGDGDVYPESNANARDGPREGVFPLKVGACTQCRARKVKCDGGGADRNSPCGQCVKHNFECHFEVHKRGRKLGSKTKRSMLEETVDPGSPVDIHTKKARKAGQTNRQAFDSELTNPLGLLATASSIMTAQSREYSRSESGAERLADRAYAGGATQDNFREILDAHPADDVISNGVLSLNEAQTLVNYFHQTFNEVTLNILDPHVFTLDYLRSRSSALLSVVCTTSARHIPDPQLALLVPALRNDIMKRLAGEGLFLLKGKRSVELVIALLIGTQYKASSLLKHLDRSWAIIGAACRMATEIGLNFPATLPKNADLFTRRVARARERAWLLLWVVDRAIAANTGRKCSVVEDHITMNAAPWSENELAFPTDRALAALVHMRRISGFVLDTLPTDGIEKAPMSSLYLNSLYNIWNGEIRRWEIEYVVPERRKPLEQRTLRLGRMAGLLTANFRLTLITRMMLLSPSSEQERWHHACFMSALEGVECILNDIPSSALRLLDGYTNFSIVYLGLILLRFRSCTLPMSGVLDVAERLVDKIEAAANDPPHKAGPGVEFAAFLRGMCNRTKQFDAVPGHIRRAPPQPRPVRKSRESSAAAWERHARASPQPPAAGASSTGGAHPLLAPTDSSAEAGRAWAAATAAPAGLPPRQHLRPAEASAGATGSSELRMAPQNPQNGQGVPPTDRQGDPAGPALPWCTDPLGASSSTCLGDSATMFDFRTPLGELDLAAFGLMPDPSDPQAFPILDQTYPAPPLDAAAAALAQFSDAGQGGPLAEWPGLFF